jgi:hypothetical protein
MSYHLDWSTFRHCGRNKEATSQNGPTVSLVDREIFPPSRDSMHGDCRYYHDGKHGSGYVVISLVVARNHQCPFGHACDPAWPACWLGVWLASWTAIHRPGR